MDYVLSEAPSYIFVHDGFQMDVVKTLLLKLLAYACLGEYLFSKTECFCGWKFSREVIYS